MSWAWRKTATTPSEYITVGLQGVGSGLLVVKALTYEQLIEKVLHAGLRFVYPLWVV